MPYTDIRIGWHLDLAHRDALIEAYKKRFPVPCYSPCPVNLGNSTTSLIIRQSHHTGNLVNQVPVPLPVPEPIPAPVPYPVYYPPAPAVSHMVTQLFLSCVPLHPVLMRVWLIRSSSRTLISMECLHHCEMNALCSWTALKTVWRCRSSQKHPLAMVR